MNSKLQTFHSNGKLLLTGEYVVLDGALALAVPTKFGQSFSVETLKESKIIWKSLDENGAIWFEDSFLIADIINHSSKYIDVISKRIAQILRAAIELNSEFLSTEKGYKIITNLDFPKNWGLGTSSTLINNVADWANVDAYQLLEKTFGGSGYDLACAKHDGPITYQLISNQPEVKEVDFHPTFSDSIYFVYLNKKQNSRDAISHYNHQKSNISSQISAINAITLEIIECSNLNDFQKLIDSHEQIISKIIKQKPIKEILFKDFEGSIKSLGAWGGDFIMVASKEDPSDYFTSQGFETIMPFQNMIK